MNARKPVLWEEQDLHTFPRLQRGMDLVILPVGATEQHGPHAPFGTDTLTVHEIAKRVSALTGAPVAPPIPYGSSLVHGEYPGTLSLTPQTLAQVVVELCEWFLKWGMRKILLLNGHGVNFPPLWVALETVRHKHPEAQVTVVTWWDASEEAQKHMFKDQPKSSFHFTPSVAHAGLGETACVMAYRPDLVHLERAVEGPKEMEGLVFKYRYHHLFPHGVKAGGKPGEATAEIGEEILNETAKALAELVLRGLGEKIPSAGA